MRKHKRVPVAASVKVSFESRGSRVTIDAFVSNISFSGIGLYADGPLDVDQDVSIELRFIGTDSMVRTTSLKGSVVYSKQIEPLYFTGIEFTEDLTSENQPVLYSHLSRIIGWDDMHG